VEHPELRSDVHLVAPRPERHPELGFGFEIAVDVGGVEEVDTGVESAEDDRRRGILIESGAEVVAPEADLRDSK
jgi:hypothetical protein